MKPIERQVRHSKNEKLGTPCGKAVPGLLSAAIIKCLKNGACRVVHNFWQYVPKSGVSDETYKMRYSQGAELQLENTYELRIA